MLRDVLVKHTPVQTGQNLFSWWENSGGVHFILNQKTFKHGLFIKKKKKKKAAGDY